MAQQIDVRLILRGINALMRSEEVQADLDARGQRMAAAAGPDFEYKRSPHKWTARGYVQSRNARGDRQEAREKRLARSISAGR